jgi:hypothetical protein
MGWTLSIMVLVLLLAIFGMQIANLVLATGTVTTSDIEKYIEHIHVRKEKSLTARSIGYEPVEVRDERIDERGRHTLLYSYRPDLSAHYLTERCVAAMSLYTGVKDGFNGICGAIVYTSSLVQYTRETVNNSVSTEYSALDSTAP